MDEFGANLARSWHDDPPDVVHAHFWMSGLATLRALEDLPRIPSVQTFHALGVVKRRHQGADDTSPVIRIETEGSIARRVDRVIATCADEVFELIRMGVPRKQVSVVPCGVDIDALRPLPSGPPTAGRKRHRVVVLGRLVPRKGVDDVVRAIAEIPGTELVIAGGPPAAALDADPDARRLRALARECGVADRVRLLGGVDRDQVVSVLRSADVVACVPWYEPFGIVPLEAMACGVPVVAAAVGGLTDTVVDGLTGLHVPPRDPAAVARAVSALLADPVGRAAMGAAGRERAVGRYGWARIAEQTADIYGRLLDVSAPADEVSGAVGGAVGGGR
jgi:glycosyltransferase involved in cell wall biosynthesis